MGQLAFIRLFLKNYVLVSIPEDSYENRRHVHVFQQITGSRRQHSVAKIWLETNGVKQVEIQESSLSAKENKLLVEEIDKHWDYINEQITLVFSGKKAEVKTIK